jgi:hypothetical protein
VKNPNTENAIIRDRLPIFEGLVAERLRPTVTKEMGFQSYELLEGDTEHRNEQKKLFMEGKIYNPDLDYPRIDEHDLSMKMMPLDLVIDQAQYVSDPVAASAIKMSAGYREAEMQWLVATKRLNDLKNQPASDEFFAAAKEYQELNEKLYGRPNEKLGRQVYGEIFAQARSKQLDERGQQIYDELYYGSIVKSGDVEVSIPALYDRELGRLPEVTDETLHDLKEVLAEECGFILELTDSYWNDIVLPRAEQDKTTPAFTVQDMEVVFNETLHQMDPENSAGITIQIIEGKKTVSWDTPTMTVQLGDKRQAIKDPKDMASKVIHELYIHGGRAIKGLKSELPVLGTGLFTDAKPDENMDYLTFEEGFATIAEMAIMGEEVSWTPVHINNYLSTLSLYDNMDFRQTYEISWRARVLMSAKSGEELTDDTIAKEKKQAYISLVRVSRGTPTALIEKPVLTFNKDLAYLEGKMKVIKYLDSVKGDKAAIKRLFTAKFDPTNETQNGLVSQYGIKDNR